MPVLDPKTSVFDAELEEDFIDTVRDTKRPYIKARINDEARPLYQTLDDYPYTIVPIEYINYPMKKGDKVKVFFLNQDAKTPILWRLQKDFPDNPIQNQYSFPTGSTLITYPTSEKTYGTEIYSNDSYIVKADSYTVFHNKDSAFVISQDQQILYTKSFGIDAREKIQIECTGTTEIQTQNNLSMEVTSSDTIALKNQISGLQKELENLYDLVSDLIDAINTNLTTSGPPPKHKVDPGWNTAVSADLLLKKANIQLIFKDN